MQKLCKFDYAVIRFVPRVEREEFINVGVILSCPDRDFLEAQIELNEERFRAFAPNSKIEDIKHFLNVISKICAGEKESGVIGFLAKRARFYWLTAVRSTIIQMSPVHSGLCQNPAYELTRLTKNYVGLL